MAKSKKKIRAEFQWAMLKQFTNESQHAWAVQVAIDAWMGGMFTYYPLLHLFFPIRELTQDTHYAVKEGWDGEE